MSAHGAKRPSQCDRVLAVLIDGQPHSVTEIHDRAGTMRLNSRVAELRERGHEILCTREGSDYIYTLLGSSGERNPQTVPLEQRVRHELSAAVTERGDFGLDSELPCLGSGSFRSPDECEQLSLEAVA